MELTLSSALSPAGMLGHLAYVLLVVSMVMRDITLLRILVVASSLVAIAYASVFLRDPVSTFWETILVIVNVVQLSFLHWRNMRARFSETEARMIALRFPDLSRGDARWFLDRGAWTRLAVHTELTREDVPVPHLTFLAKGEVGVYRSGTCVARCMPGDFIGEMTVMAGTPATATTRALGEVEVWQIGAADLREMIARKDRFATVLEAAFSRNYRDKLIRFHRLAPDGPDA